MLYCIFENTFRDLQECYEILCNKDLEDLSDKEQKFAKYLIKLCKEFSNDFSKD